MTNGNAQRYDGLSRLLHWSMAVLIALQFLKIGDRIDDGEHWIGQTIVPTHVSLGALILVLVALRLLWALKRRGQGPQHVGPMAPFVRLGHGLLYACMIALPITGILYIVGSGYALTIFGMELVAKTEVEIPWMAALGAYHSPIGLLLVALVAGHVLITLYHHFIRKDDTLLRMWG